MKNTMEIYLNWKTFNYEMSFSWWVRGHLKYSSVGWEMYFFNWDDIRHFAATSPTFLLGWPRLKGLSFYLNPPLPAHFPCLSTISLSTVLSRPAAMALASSLMAHSPNYLLPCPVLPALPLQPPFPLIASVSSLVHILIVSCLNYCKLFLLGLPWSYLASLPFLVRMLLP